MAFNSLVSVIPVKDFAISCKWYALWIGRVADFEPVPDIAEWKICTGGWLQVRVDHAHAGSTVIVLGTDNLLAERAIFERAGISPSEVNEVPGVVRTCDVIDPDGNVITLVEEIS